MSPLETPRELFHEPIALVVVCDGTNDKDAESKILSLRFIPRIKTLPMGIYSRTDRRIRVFTVDGEVL